MPRLIRSLIVDNGFLVIFKMEAKLSMGLGCRANLTCAESEQQEVVDELLVLGHAKFLLREPGLHVKVADPQP